MKMPLAGESGGIHLTSARCRGTHSNMDLLLAARVGCSDLRRSPKAISNMQGRRRPNESASWQHDEQHNSKTRPRFIADGGLALSIRGRILHEQQQLNIHALSRHVIPIRHHSTHCPCCEQMLSHLASVHHRNYGPARARLLPNCSNVTCSMDKCKVLLIILFSRDGSARFNTP